MIINVCTFEYGFSKVWRTISHRLVYDLQKIYPQYDISFRQYNPQYSPKENIIMIVVGAYAVSPPINREKIRLIVFQTEQPTSGYLAPDSNFMNNWIPIVEQIWDFSYQNLNKWGNKGYFVPFAGDEKYIVNENDLSPKHHGIIFIGSMNERRNKIISELRKNGLTITIYTGYDIWGDHLNMILDHCKIVLNIHYYENASLETERITNALSRGCCVVSERSNDEELDNMFEDSIILTDDLVETLIYLIDDDTKMDMMRKNALIFSRTILNFRRNKIKEILG